MLDESKQHKIRLYSTICGSQKWEMFSDGISVCFVIKLDLLKKTPVNSTLHFIFSSILEKNDFGSNHSIKYSDIANSFISLLQKSYPNHVMKIMNMIHIVTPAPLFLLLKNIELNIFHLHLILYLSQCSIFRFLWIKVSC